METNTRLKQVISISYLIAIAIFALSLALYVYSIRLTPKGNVSDPYSYNMYFPEKASDTQVRYYNGNTFLAMDINTQKTTPLTSHKVLSGITQVFWLEKGVVFATQEVNPFSDLEAVSQRILSESPSSSFGSVPTYWYLSFETNAINPVSTNVIQPEMFGIETENGEFIFRDGAEGSYSILRNNGEIEYGVINLSDDETRPIYADNEALIYAVQGDTVNSDGSRESEHVDLRRIPYYSDEESVISEDLFGDKTSTIYSQVHVLDKDLLLVAKANSDGKPGSDLALFTPSNSRRETIIKGFDGTVVGQQTLSAIRQGKGVDTLQSINNSGVIGRLRIAKNELSAPASSLSFNDRFLLVYTNGTAVMVSKDTAHQPAKEVFNGALEKKIKLTNGSTLTREIESPSDTTYTLTFNGRSNDALEELYRNIRALGYDPHQFTIHMVAGRTGVY